MDFLKRVKALLKAIKSLLVLGLIIYGVYFIYTLSKTMDLTDLDAVNSYLLALPVELLLGAALLGLIGMAQIWD